LSLLFCWDPGDSLERMKACIKRVRFCRPGWGCRFAWVGLLGSLTGFYSFSALMDGCDGCEGLRMSFDLDDDLEVVVLSDSDWLLKLE